MVVAYVTPFLSSIFSVVVQNLETLVKSEIKLQRGVKKELKHLLKTLKVVGLALRKGEETVSSDESVQFWLSELRDVAYDMEDIMDYCRLEAKFLVDPPMNPISVDADSLSRRTCAKIKCWASSSCLTTAKARRDISTRIKTVNEKLDRIRSNKSLYKDLASSPNIITRQEHDQDKAETTELTPQCIVGENIHDNKERLVQLICSDKDGGGKNVSALAIVGMPGVGKTTIAQMIMRDSNLQQRFDKTMWVYVSREFEDNKLLRTVIQAAGVQCGDNDPKNALVNALLTAVNDKMIFLVLDDVHDGNKIRELLEGPLEKSRRGSWILVTSRYNHVANEIGVDETCRMNPLNEEEGWSLLCSTVFTKAADSDKEHLKDAGMKIIEKCGCLPLAIKAIGGVLRKENCQTLIRWENILNHQAWNLDSASSVTRILYMSYLYLRHELKQCFIWLPLLQVRESFYKDELVSYWIAEGFLKERDAEALFDELVSRNLLLHYYTIRGTAFYRMHDLMRDIATTLGKEENYFGEIQSLNSKPWLLGLRRLSLINVESLEDYDPKSHCETLRTLIFLNSNRITSIPERVFKMLTFLRVLSLRETGIELLPDTIGCLGLLRYLDVSHNPIISLPNSIGKLFNLMFLHLESCKKLCCLPDAIVGLTKLSHLRLYQTKICQMPRGMRALRHLTVLDWRVEEIKSEEETEVEKNKHREEMGVERTDNREEIKVEGAETGEGTRAGVGTRVEKTESGRGMKELGYLTKLTNLTIHNVQRLQSREEASLAALHEKKHLSYLRFNCNPPGGREIPTSTKRIEEVFKGLEPPGQLQILTIMGFCGRLPSWLSKSVLQITDLRIEYGFDCHEFPALGQLPLLKNLEIDGVKSLAKLNCEFFTSGTEYRMHRPFPSLEVLMLNKLWDLTECQWDGPGESSSATEMNYPFPNLRDMTVGGCPRLLSLWSCLQYATSLTTLMLRDLDSLESIPSLPALRTLTVKSCPSIRQTGTFTVLHTVGLIEETAQAVPPWLGLLRRPTPFPSSAPLLHHCILYLGSIDCLRRVCPWVIGNQFYLFYSIPIVLVRNARFYVAADNSQSMVRASLPEGIFRFDRFTRELVYGISRDIHTLVEQPVPGDCFFIFDNDVEVYMKTEQDPRQKVPTINLNVFLSKINSHARNEQARMTNGLQGQRQE